jgi:chemotaxis protein histidine kinase CheA
LQLALCFLVPYRRYLGEWAAIFEYLARIASTEAGGNSFDSSAAPASMDALVKQCEAAGEAVKAAKAGGDAADIKAKVAALVKIKEEITKLDPAHPMVIVDKKAAKKKAKAAAAAAKPAEKPAEGGGDKPLSKNAQKAAAKKALKDAKKKQHKEGGAAAPPAAAAAAPTQGFALRPGASAAARAKVAAVAKACKVTVAKGAAGAYAPQPSDGCVLDTPNGPVGGAANACRLLAFASSAFSAETPAADGWCDWSGRADAEAQAQAVVDEVGKALAKNDPGLAKGTLARILVACDCKVALKSAKGSPAVTALANEVAGEEKPWSPAQDESTLEFVTRLFAEAIKRAAPSLKDQDPVVQRCAIASFGDFQCNAPMGIFKALKGQGDTTYNSPRAVGAAIADNLPPNSVLVSASVAPAGFVNAKIDNALLGDFCRNVAQQGKAPPPPIKAFGGKRKVLVDFSSPNIAKEMHVGHLRSTIIGDTICRVLEYCGHDVHRINHVGDWGTQFGVSSCGNQAVTPSYDVERGATRRWRRETHAQRQDKTKTQACSSATWRRPTRTLRAIPRTLPI